ncbi:hypothetical protein [Allosphingosinicella flava]|nr:hypothetical protein [Sphingosinicella flava]
MTLLKRQKPVHLVAIAVGIGLLALAAGPVAAMAADPVRKTPDNFAYDIKDGKRVPKAGNRVTNPDGSWREERQDGDCVIVREKTASGEYRETRSC